MTKLIKVVSKTGECLCKGCPLFLEDKYSSCPVSSNNENLNLIGEAFSNYDSTGDPDNRIWCDFKYCGISTVSTDTIKDSPGYRVKGLHGRTMWFPESIVEPIVKEKQKIVRKARSLLARLGTKPYG